MNQTDRRANIIHTPNSNSTNHLSKAQCNPMKWQYLMVDRGQLANEKIRPIRQDIVAHYPIEERFQSFFTEPRPIKERISRIDKVHLFFLRREHPFSQHEQKTSKPFSLSLSLLIPISTSTSFSGAFACCINLKSEGFETISVKQDGRNET